MSARLIDLVSDCFVAMSHRQPLLVSTQGTVSTTHNPAHNPAYKLTYAEVKSLNFIQPNARR